MDKDPFAVSAIKFLMPRVLTARTATQGGLFSMHPVPNADTDGFAAESTACIDLADYEGSQPGPDIESFPMQVWGRFNDGKAIVQEAAIDTTSFYN